MAIENLLQNFANATGIIIDRTFDPPRVLGQAFLVSKSRMVTCAGCIFNYAEIPWALAIRFPHPEVTLGVKTITLHPEFDRKEARAIYLNQTASSKFTYPVQFNDLATMVVQSELREPDLELAGQLHRALSLPFSSEGVQSSGVIHGREFVEVVKNTIASRQSGLLTVFDELNIPIAYLQFAGGTIERVYFQGIAGEMAFAELIYRQPGKGFALRPDENFVWGELRKIEIPTENLLAESVKRTEEMPAMLSSVGGPEARYQKVVKEFNIQIFNSNVQWLISNLWEAIDGYITVDQLSPRVGADTYTILQGLRELANQGVISLINRQTPFHMNGQLGTPIVSHTDFDINPGDTLKAFYVDPISGAPCWLDGDFAGVASVLQPKNLLHSIPVRIKVPGALILKNYKLIGVHNGTVAAKTGQSSMDRQLYQMMWIGALFDMSSKKLRTGAESGDDTEAALTSAENRYPSLRDRHEEEERAPATEKPLAYICQSCFANNAQLGNCFNCGAVVTAQPLPPKKEGFFHTTVHIKALSDLQEKYKLTDKQMFAGIGGCFAVLFLLIIIITASNSTPSAPPVAVNQPANQNDQQSVELAVNVVGFKGIAPPGYWFADTAALTSPLASFGLFSNSSNQKVVFVIFNDMSPVQALDRFTQIPPFSDVTAAGPEEAQGGKTEKGSQILGDSEISYYVRTYPTANGSKKVMLIGSFPAKESGRGVLVLGQALKEGAYDYKSTLFLIDNMAESRTKSGNMKRAGGPISGNTASTSSSERGAASEEQINKYCQIVQDRIKKKIDNENDLLDQVKKRTDQKLKVVIEIDIDSSGDLTKMDIAEPDKRQKTNDDLVKIINSCAPFKDVPKTEDGTLSLRITFKNGNLKVQPSD